MIAAVAVAVALLLVLVLAVGRSVARRGRRTPERLLTPPMTAEQWRFLEEYAASTRPTGKRRAV